MWAIESLSDFAAPGQSAREEDVRRHPERFRLRAVTSPDDHSDQRWSIDTAGDYELVRRIYDAAGRDDFSWREAVAIVAAHPDWRDLNREVVQKVVPPAGNS